MVEKVMILAAGAAALLLGTSSASLAENAVECFIENTTIETMIGDLEFEKGFPTADTAEKLVEFKTFYRAVEVVTQNTSAVSMHRMRKGYADAGAGKPNEIILIPDLLRHPQEFLTGNSTTVYAFTYLDLNADGPTVVVAPPEVLGFADSMWMRFIADIGPFGPDKGKGGKFLFLPPNYEGLEPEGYFTFRSPTFGVWVLMRGGLVDGKPDAPAERLRQIEVYPLAQADNPEPTVFVNGSELEIFTVHSENFEYLEQLGDLVASEHPNAVSGGQKFFLASIGMEFGKPFNPDPETKKLLEQAALVGAASLRNNTWNYPGEIKLYYEDRRWWTPFVGGSHTFDPNGYLDFDMAALFATFATGVTPAMVSKKVGVGSQYLAAHSDKDGNPLDGAKIYKLTIPADVPVKDFWSVTVYDSASRSMLATDQEFPAISSYSELELNEDGSVDLYFGPDAPVGKEKNWVQTDPAKGWATLFRAYGPTEAYFDKSWQVGDFELIE